MKVYLYDLTYPEAEDKHEEYASQVENDARKIDGFQKVDLVDIEHGAGCPGFGLSYEWFAAGAIAVLLAGPVIEKGIDSWAKLAERLVSLLNWFRAKGHEPFVDSESAALLALKRIVESEEHISSLRLLEHVSIGRVHGTIFSAIAGNEPDDEEGDRAECGEADMESSLWDQSQAARAAANGCDVFVFAVNEACIVTVGITTTGNVQFVGSMKFT